MAAQKVSLHKETATKTMAHNDRTLYNEDYFKDAETPEHWTPFGDDVTVAESEMRIYRELFSDALMAQNERALAMYKPERVMTMEQWHEKHMPQEIVFGVGNAENPGSIEDAGLLAWKLKEIVEASGGTVISIDLHRERMFDDEDDVAAIRRGEKTVDECPYVIGSGHGHMRVVWAHEGKVDVANTLEAHGFLREKPDQKRTKRNNEAKTFTAFARTSLEDYAEHTLGLEIDRTRDKGAASLSPRDYANMKQVMRKMQEREQQADIAIEAAQEAARHDMAHSMFMAELAAEQDAQMIRDAVLADAEEEADRIREVACADAAAEREDAARRVSQAQEKAAAIVEAANAGAEATIQRADQRAMEIVAGAQSKAIDVTTDALVAVSEAKARVEEHEQDAATREREAREARNAFKAAESAYKTATPTVAGISPGAFLKRCFAKLTELARPRKNPFSNVVNLGDEPYRDEPETLGDQQAFNALAFVQRFFAKIGKTIEEFGDEVARDIAREQARTQAPDRHAVARAKQAEKDWFARTFGSKTEMGGTTHGRGGMGLGE